MTKPAFDVLILGGGVVGMSTACHLAMRGATNYLRVAVVERDASYRQASAVLSAGGLRQQFSLAENIKMSLYGLEFIRAMPSWPQAADVQFREQGYVFTAGSAVGAQTLRENHELQTASGADIEIIEKAQLRAAFPWMNTSNITLASRGRTGEGWFDPWTMLSNMKRRAREGGVTFIQGALQDLTLTPSKTAISSAAVQDESGQLQQLTAGTFVMAAGAWAAASGMDKVVQRLGGIGTFGVWPVRPRRRCIFNFHCPSATEHGVDRAGLTVDPSGVYFRPEGKGSDKFICGVSPTEDEDVDLSKFDSRDVDHSLFEEVIWPTLASRVPAFEEIKVKASWSGLYEYSTLDQNAFMGRMPQVDNLLICNGFSGHGLQQSPAAGRAMAELVVDGRYTTLDLSIFGMQRLLTSPPTPVLERNIV